MSDTLHGHPDFYKKLSEIKTIHSVKNHDYAGEKDPLANFRECERIGIPAWKGCLIRMMDKYMRILNFADSQNFEVSNESLDDTCKDLSVYSLIMSILYAEYDEETQKDAITRSSQPVVLSSCLSLSARITAANAIHVSSSKSSI